MSFDQIGIAFFGLLAIALTQQEDAGRRRWACWFGLAGQPFWFYSSFVAEQWGIAVLAVFYTIAWLEGVRVHWFKGGGSDGA